MLINKTSGSGSDAAAQSAELAQQVVVKQEGSARESSADPDHMQQGHADDARQAEFRAALDAHDAPG